MAKSQAEWMAEALAEMQKAQWPPQKWCQTIDDREDYQWVLTHNYKAQVAMWNAAHPAPNPTPPTPVVVPESQYVIFCANNPEAAFGAPKKYRIALSADPAYSANLPSIISMLRAKGYAAIAGWCDCRTEGGTPATAGKAFVAQHGLDYFIGQAESAAEFDNALSAGAKVVVGNLTALRSDQAKLIEKGVVSLIQEDYWNEGWARADSPLISAYCAGIYATSLWDPTIAQYQSAGRWRDGDGLFHAASVKDWQSLP